MYRPLADAEPEADPDIAEEPLVGAPTALLVELEQAANAMAAATPPTPSRNPRREPVPGQEAPAAPEAPEVRASAVPVSRSSSVRPAAAACIRGRYSWWAWSNSRVSLDSSPSEIGSSQPPLAVLTAQPLH